MLVLVIIVIIAVVVIMVVSLLSGMSFKSFIEVGVAVATIAGVIMAGISFYYKGKERKIASSMDRILTILSMISRDDEIRCIWTEMYDTNCTLSSKGRLEILCILKNLDASLYTESTDESIHFIIDRLLSSHIIQDIWNENRFLFSTKFNKYVAKIV